MSRSRRRDSGSDRRASSPLAASAASGATRAAVALLVLATVAVYGRVAGFGFIDNYDDSIYVTGNAHVKTGLSSENVRWAFTQPCAGNWHPLTMLSHMADCQLFGPTPGPAHLVNVLLHILNTVLLFHVLRVATRRPWPSLAVAGLFALHPMHVESVAWIAERKDVLSTFFWLATMGAYVRYARVGGAAAYALVATLPRARAHGEADARDSTLRPGPARRTGP